MVRRSLVESEQEESICVIVKMKGGADPRAIKEVEPRDLVTFGRWRCPKRSLGLLLGF